MFNVVIVLNIVVYGNRDGKIAINFGLLLNMIRTRKRFLKHHESCNWPQWFYPFLHGPLRFMFIWINNSQMQGMKKTFIYLTLNSVEWMLKILHTRQLCWTCFYLVITNKGPMSLKEILHWDLLLLQKKQKTWITFVWKLKIKK